jgi:hypothetical protein
MRRTYRTVCETSVGDVVEQIHHFFELPYPTIRQKTKNKKKTKKGKRRKKTANLVVPPECGYRGRCSFPSDSPPSTNLIAPIGLRIFQYVVHIPVALQIGDTMVRKHKTTDEHSHVFAQVRLQTQNDSESQVLALVLTQKIVRETFFSTLEKLWM